MSTPSPIPSLESPSETRQMRETGPALTGRLPADLRPYLAVNAMLIAIWAATGAGYFWPIWPSWGGGSACWPTAVPRTAAAPCSGPRPHGSAAMLRGLPRTSGAADAVAPHSRVPEADDDLAPLSRERI